MDNMDIDGLILSGALEPVGIDPESGEMLYNFTSKLKEINPILHREVNNKFSEDIMALWELDMISMDITEKNPIVTLTSKAFDDELINKLDEETSFTLKEIKRSFSRQ
jgi:lysophospholipid acyltransferase (LPLAT)-like uncharacterized protein